MIAALEKEGYRENFPMCHMNMEETGWNRPNMDIKSTPTFNKMNAIGENWYMKMTCPGEVEKFFDLIKLYHLFGRICLLKCEILKSLGDTIDSENWSYLHLFLISDIHASLIHSK